MSAEALSSLRIDLEPPHGTFESPRAPAARLTRLYLLERNADAEQASRAARFELALVDAEGAVLREEPSIRAITLPGLA